MIRIDHISIAAKNVFEAADRLRAETGLGFYDGGWTDTGLASRIFPLTRGCYILLEGIVDAYALQDSKNVVLKRFYDQAAAGDRFRGFALGVDSMDDLRQIATRLKFGPVADPKGGRVMPSGDKVAAAGVGNVAEAWPKGLPNWNFFPDMPTHPGGQPPVASPGLVHPAGVAWLEVGGSEGAMRDWIGPEMASLPLRFNGKAPGVYAVAVSTAKGEVVVRRKSVSEA